ncbi:DUF6585 family protein [Micromonospora sp. NPDC002389]|uniref:DUF6585 family protein n=1 Tax=Micromonospora sp. NPDC002389 TaxID=3154272 RepID=UPI00331C24B5
MSGLPASIEDTAEEIGFGQVERAFRPTYSLSVSSTLSFLLLAVLFGIATTAVTATVGIVVLGGLTVAAVLLAGWGAVDTRRLIRRRFYLCDGGLLTAENHTRLTRVIAWTDIAEVWRYHLRMYSENGATTMHRCRLRLTDGTRVNLEKPPLVDGEELGEQVERRAASARLPQVLAELASAGRVEFGPLTVTPDGIASAGGYAAFSDIAVVRLRRVRLKIWTRDAAKPVSVLVRRVPNLWMLVLILQRHGAPTDIELYRPA